MNADPIEPGSRITGASVQNTWKLLAPDWASLDTVWHNAAPFVLWPVGNQPLLAHWMDEAVRRGVDIVELYVADRPAEVRAWIENGAYWSRRVRVIPIGAEQQAPSDSERIDHLPGLDPPSLPKFPEELPRHWFNLQKQWLATRSIGLATIERLHPSGGWVGPQARIHPSVRLSAPFWIGARARIGAACQIGPNALIAEGAILDDGAHVREACVLPQTYLGQNTSLIQSAAVGNLLLDFRRGCRVEIEEPFIMGPVIDIARGPRLPTRLLALCCWALLAPFTWLSSGGKYNIRPVRWRDGTASDLVTGRHGPLWLRRSPWLWHLAAGRLYWIGILPRSLLDPEHVPEEIARTMRLADTGFFSLADVHGCHDPDDPEEWVHAAYQASAAGENAGSVVLRNLWKIAWSQKNPPSPV